MAYNCNLLSIYVLEVNNNSPYGNQLKILSMNWFWTHKNNTSNEIKILIANFRREKCRLSF